MPNQERPTDPKRQFLDATFLTCVKSFIDIRKVASKNCLLGSVGSCWNRIEFTRLAETLGMEELLLDDALRFVIG